MLGGGGLGGMGEGTCQLLLYVRRELSVYFNLLLKNKYVIFKNITKALTRAKENKRCVTEIEILLKKRKNLFNYRQFFVYMRKWF